MSKKTLLSIVVLVIFVAIALSSASPSSVSRTPSSYGYERYESGSSGSKLQKTEFPKTAQKCPSCYGNGCARCNYTGSILR